MAVIRSDSSSAAGVYRSLTTDIALGGGHCFAHALTPSPASYCSAPARQCDADRSISQLDMPPVTCGLAVASLSNDSTQCVRTHGVGARQSLAGSVGPV